MPTGVASGSTRLIYSAVLVDRTVSNFEFAMQIDAVTGMSCCQARASSVDASTYPATYPSSDGARWSCA